VKKDYLVDFYTVKKNQNKKMRGWQTMRASGCDNPYGDYIWSGTSRSGGNEIGYYRTDYIGGRK